MDEGVAEEARPDIVEETSRTTSKPSVKKGLFGLLRREKTLEEAIPVPKESTGQDGIPTNESTQDTPEAETEVNPEELKNTLRHDLKKAVDLQVEAHFKEESLDVFKRGKYRDDPEILARLTEIERLRVESRELSAELIGRLDGARKTLGNFCNTVEADDGKRAVVLLSPLTREVTQTVLGGPGNPKDAGKPLYKITGRVEDVFFVNTEGVFKHSIEDPEQHNLENVGHQFYEWREGEELQKQMKNDKRLLDMYHYEWGNGIGLAFDSKENVGKHVYLAPKEEYDNPKLRKQREEEAIRLRGSIIGRLTGYNSNIEGAQQYEIGLAEPLYNDYNQLSLTGVKKVTTSLDVEAAFDSSVAVAEENKAKYGADFERNYLFSSEPNPVSAEPMTTDN